MLELIQKLLIGHYHKWERKETENVEDSRGGLAGKIIILQCSICGKLKNHKVIW